MPENETTNVVASADNVAAKDESKETKPVAAQETAPAETKEAKDYAAIEHAWKVTQTQLSKVTQEKNALLRRLVDAEKDSEDINLILEHVAKADGAETLQSKLTERKARKAKSQQEDEVINSTLMGFGFEADDERFKDAREASNPLVAVAARARKLLEEDRLASAEKDIETLAEQKAEKKKVEYLEQNKNKFTAPDGSSIAGSGGGLTAEAIRNMTDEEKVARRSEIAGMSLGLPSRKR